jgi:hypothetical protein
MKNGRDTLSATFYCFPNPNVVAVDSAGSRYITDVIAHSGFHQRARDPIFHLHHLAHQQVLVA